MSNNILDAQDALNRARDITRYLIDKKTREDDPGEGWILGVVEDGITEAMKLLETPEADPDADATAICEHVDRAIAEARCTKILQDILAQTGGVK